MPTILLVDDDPDVCTVVTLVLQGEGYEVVCASSVDQAVHLLRSERPFDLILTEVDLGAGNDAGIALVFVARTLRPQIQVIYTSGTGLSETAAANLVPRSTYLPKPYGPPELRNLARRLVGADA